MNKIRRSTDMRKFMIIAVLLLVAGCAGKPALEVYDANALSLNVNISNLFDSRTYAVSPVSNGIETGRQFWLGINYAFN